MDPWPVEAGGVAFYLTTTSVQCSSKTKNATNILPQQYFQENYCNTWDHIPKDDLIKQIIVDHLINSPVFFLPRIERYQRSRQHFIIMPVLIHDLYATEALNFWE